MKVISIAILIAIFVCMCGCVTPEQMENRPTTLNKWSAYEHPIDKVFCGCNLIRSQPDVDMLPAAVGVESE